MRELERRFPPEFRNRIDEVVLFAPLTHDEVREIARHYLQQVTDDAGEGRQDDHRSTTRRWSWWSSKGYSMAFGARFLKRFIDEHIKLPISAQWKNGSHFDVKAKDGQLVVEPGHREGGVDDARLRRRRLAEGRRPRGLTRRTRPARLSCGAAADGCSASASFRFAQAVALLQHAHHRLHFLAVRLGRIFLHVQPLEARPHRRKLALDEAP